MKLLILCACVALAVSETTILLPDPTPAAPLKLQGRALPGFGPQPFAGFPQYPLPYQPHPAPKVVSPLPLPKTVAHVVPQQYNVQHSHTFIPILKQTQDLQHDAGYQWEYQSGNGISAFENAQIVLVAPEQATKSVQGGYSYTSLEGIPVEVTYTADEHGFHPHVVVHTHGVHERRPVH